MKTFDLILLSGSEQAKMLVMVLFSIALFVLVPLLFGKKPNEEISSKLEEDKKTKNNTNGKIRTDGYYISKYEALTEFNEIILIHFFIIFTKNGLVGLLEIEDYDEWRMNNSDEDIKELILESSKITEIKNPQISAKYKLKDGQIRMKFFDPDDYSNSDLENILNYDKWYGSIINNALVLSFDKAYFNDALQDYVVENQIKNLKFQFKQLN
ncbi:hypothetical protein [Flavobacterium sp.]|jgi:hypothetical protein|uniref:hypothetical protein n=1 Tax=Flavobacterium sp. TaxID=239 RepID=UPI0037BF4E4E